MQKNIILSISAVFMQIFRLVIALFAVIQIVVVLVYYFKSASLNEIIGQIQSFSVQYEGLNIYELTTSSPWLAFFLLLHNVTILLLLFIMLGQGIRIVKNIHSLKTFTIDNIKAFNRISQIAILLIIINFIKLSPDKIAVGIEFNYIFLAFGAIILTQVFKEGHRLLEDNELTV